MSELTRREFMKMLGIAAGGTAVGGMSTLWALPDELVEEALRGPGIESFINTACGLCPGGCGIRVRLIDRIPVHIDGNPAHPVNRGGICPHGAAGLDFLYNPDRIRQPLVRVGPMGSGRGGEWREIGWDEALSIVTKRLSNLRERGTPEKVAFFMPKSAGTMHDLVSRWMEGFGSKNLVTLDEGQMDFVPFELLLGWKDVPKYDIANAAYVLAFGANFLEDGASPVHGIHNFGKMRDRRQKVRGRFTFVDSRHSLTSASADRFVAIKPGTHGAVALAVAHVLISQDLHDAKFIARHVTGFEDWVDDRGVPRKGFKAFVLEGYSPKRVSSMTGVPESRLIEVAMEFGRQRPAVAMIGDMGWDTTNGLWNALSVISLNLIAGNIGDRGGLRPQKHPQFQSLPRVRPDEKARAGLAQPSLAADAAARAPFHFDPLLGFVEGFRLRQTSPIDTLFVYRTNPAFDHPHARRIRRVLDRIPFIVSFAGVMDEVSAFANLIIPDHSYLENWDDIGSTAGTGFASASIGHPVVKPFYNTRNAGDVLITIARELGGSVAKAIPYRDFQTAARHRFEGLYKSGKGALIPTESELARAGGNYEKIAPGRPQSFDRFWKELQKRGGWWDRTTDSDSARAAIQTRNGKASLFLHGIAAKAGWPGHTDRRLLEEWRVRQEGDAAFMPHFEAAEFEGEDDGYPYFLVPFGVLSNRRGTGSFSPLLQEMFGYYNRIYWDSWVELSAETAHRHHIKEGDPVEITSKEGTIVARAVFNQALEPHIVAVPFGMGHTAGGRYAKGVGVNPYEILAEATDVLWGKPLKAATAVRIKKSERRLS